MPRVDNLIDYKTTVAKDGDDTLVTTHETIIVKFNDDQIRLNSGGWKTNKTKNDMNRASNQFGLGYHVYQKRHGWFVDYNGENIKFRDGMTLAR